MHKTRKNGRIILLCAITVIIAIQTNQPAKANQESSRSEITKCEFHGINSKLCTRCNPDLIPEFKAKGDWCAGHNLPESQCDLCDYGRAHGLNFDTDDQAHEGHDHEDGEEHVDEHIEELIDVHDHDDEIKIEVTQDHTKSEFQIFYPENNAQCANDGAVIQLASIRTAERMGLTVRPAMAVESSPFIEAPAQIVFDETETTVLSTTIPALVKQWLVEPGQEVSQGELIAVLSSPSIPTLKAEYLEAHASWLLAKKRFERQKELYEKELISDDEFEDSETEFAVAEAHLAGKAGILLSSGLSSKDLNVIIADKLINQALKIYAPYDGVILERIAVLGELLDEGSPLAIVGDPGALWIEAQVKEEDASYFSLGDEIVFSSDGNSLKRCSGEVIWIAQYLDNQTRSLTVRARINKAADRPHSGEFGRVFLDTRNKHNAVIIPKDAVQWEGCCNVVFVKETIDRYRPRKVNIEPAGNGYYRAIDGVNAGDEIVVNGSFLMKTELRKGSLGAGCCGF